MQSSQPTISEERALQRLTHLCAHSEYCSFDMQRKMQAWNLDEATRQRILDYLTKERYIDENRFAHAFVRDKARYNRWGERRIAFELRKRNIGDDDISDALTELESLDPLSTLTDLLRQKVRTTKARNEFELLQKLMRFAAQRGFTSDQVTKVFKGLLRESEG